MKIVYFIPHLREPSGINRVLSIKANYMADVLDYDVTIITYRQFQSAVFFPFSSEVKLIHLNLDDPTFRLKSLGFFERRKSIKKFMVSYENLVEKFLLENQVDVCVSMVLGAEYKFLYKIKDKSKKVLEFHLNFDNSPLRILTKPFHILRIKSLLQIKNLRSKMSRYEKIVVLSNDDAKTWKLFFSNITVIGNPLTIDLSLPRPNLTSKTAIAVGRLEKEKGFDYLVEAWKIVKEKHPEWILNIFGEGSLEDNILRQIKDLNLEDTIFLKKSVPNIAEKYLESSIFILSSRNEGFVLVLMEALALGIPAVSFNCKFGPEELIEDGKNGFLVELGNIEMLAEKIITLIEDESLRQIFSERALLTTKKYEIANIMKRWEELFQSLVKNN
ncbi:glycosyltransferase family 4 protein [Chryseobacterium wangxinyae]|uniref:glycosyltransferase family 4 protein n=1 Tax=Chryseobacterium sp. CY350 TaxID=2997336 RepID=UPI002270C29D|nr:glycosyltransferase family 4 protein [Chryseobacterium sp. CY350]MCY0975839.1 glycosyltransferase family 4 protein [Chryseobacterium sp. CY350]WBZ94552.1 glycosyltransferase family 4 protein [Chryseobacterium sp. CY350]